MRRWLWPDRDRANAHTRAPAKPARPHLLSCGGAHKPRLLDRRQAYDLAEADRKSTRLNSSHQIISYAVFCLKKKNTDYYLLAEKMTLRKKREKNHKVAKEAALLHRERSSGTNAMGIVLDARGDVNS